MSLRASSTSSRAVPDFHVRRRPIGELDADPACGTLMGNRGRLTNANGDVVRDWKHEGWITCNSFGAPAPGDLNPPRMYEAVIPRRGDRVRCGSPALRQVPAPGDEGIPRALAQTASA